MPSPNRIFFACNAIGLSRDGSTTYTPIHGCQSIGLTTTFNLEQVFEIGQLAIYENIENIPDIECTIERVLDGYPLAYHLATRDNAGNSLVGRSNDKCGIAMSFYGDTQSSASGTPIAEVNMSGMYVNSLTYTLPLEGNCTEQVSFIGSNKTWKTSSFTFTGTLFDNSDQPLALTSGLGGVQRRENVLFGTSKLPYGTNGIYGISTSGTNNKTAGQFAVHVQDISITTNLNRTNVLELGRREPYYRYVNFPIEVTTSIGVLTTYGDNVQATETGVIPGSGTNLSDQTIIIALEDTTIFNMGTRNKLSNATYSGGDTSGANAVITYSYSTFNDLVISQAQMP